MTEENTHQDELRVVKVIRYYIHIYIYTCGRYIYICESSVTTGMQYRSDRRQPLLEDRARKRPPVGGEQQLSGGSNRFAVSTLVAEPSSDRRASGVVRP